MRIFAILIIATLSLSACSSWYTQPDLKSPCVGTDDSPCGPKRHVNQNMG